MRAAQTIRRPALLAPRRHAAETPRRERALSSPQTLPRMGCVVAFFAGYLPGIWLGRGGSALAAAGGILHKKPRWDCLCGSLRSEICGVLFAAQCGAALWFLRVGHRAAGSIFCGARGVSGLLRGVRYGGKRRGGTGAISRRHDDFGRCGAAAVPVAGILGSAAGSGTVPCSVRPCDTSDARHSAAAGSAVCGSAGSISGFQCCWRLARRCRRQGLALTYGAQYTAAMPAGRTPQPAAAARG